MEKIERRKSFNIVCLYYRYCGCIGGCDSMLNEALDLSGTTFMYLSNNTGNFHILNWLSVKNQSLLIQCDLIGG
jgi:hypothetical protein